MATDSLTLTQGPLDDTLRLRVERELKVRLAAISKVKRSKAAREVRELLIQFIDDEVAKLTPAQRRKYVELVGQG